MFFLRKFLCCLILIALVLPSPATAAGLTLLRDEETEQALRIMSKPIFDQAGLQADNVRFILIDNPALNAFVAGGQNIFLHSGLILSTDNPEELLGVIAHETGHISSGHLFRGRADMSNLSLQAMLAQILGIMVAVGTKSAEAGVSVGSASNSMLMRTFLRHTRTQEGSADQSGIRFLEGAGLPLNGFVSFMKKLSSQELLPETQQSEYVRTHPLTSDRIDALEHAAQQRPGGSVPPAWVELHQRIKAKLQGYLFPDQALQKKDTSVATQYGHAVAWFRKNDVQKALASLDPLIKAEPKNPYFLELRGQIMFENSRIEEAVAAYGKAVELAPSSGLLRIAYAHSLLESKADQKARIDEAIKQLLFAIQREKNTSDPHHLLAIAYGKKGEEGLSRLHLAEEALMQGKLSFAKREAMLAQANLKKGTPSYLRSADILEAVSSAEKKKKGNNDNDE